jgi:hypothetical protein
LYLLSRAPPPPQKKNAEASAEALAQKPPGGILVLEKVEKDFKANFYNVIFVCVKLV